MAAKTKTYENPRTGQREELDANAQSTKDRVNAGELREVPAGEAGGTAAGGGR
jgi:hypothetical protein